MKHVFSARLFSTLAVLILLLSLCNSAFADTPDPRAAYKFDHYANYTLETFLKGYNIISFGDASIGIHCMGGVLVDGNFTAKNPYDPNAVLGFADGENLPPSFVGGKVSRLIYNQRNKPTNAPLYVGTINNVTESNGVYKVNDIETGRISSDKTSPVFKSDDFISMEEVWNTVVSAAETLRASCTTHLELNENKASIPFGSHVTIDGKDMPQWESQFNFTGDVDDSAQKNTLIVIEGAGSIQLPQIKINNGDFQSDEISKDGTSIIWYLPNATSVRLSSSPWLGHVIAPNATVTSPQNNYNGCIIGNKIELNGEGHLHNYNSPDLLPRNNPLHLMAHKKVEIKKAGYENMPWHFTFKLTPEGNAPMPDQDTATVTSNDPIYMGKAIARFGDIEYDTPGTYTYFLREHNQNNTNGFTVDTREYKIVVKVETIPGDTRLAAFASYYLGDTKVSHMEFNNVLQSDTDIEETAHPGSIKLRKVDSKDGTPLSGAVFTIYTDHARTQVYGVMQPTDDQGVSEYTGLFPDIYYLRETTPPKGYGINHDLFTVTVEENETNTVYYNSPIANVRGTGSVQFTKTLTDKDSDEKYAFRITLTGKDYKEVYAEHVYDSGNTICQATSHDLIHDGEALVYLADGETMVIKAIPAGMKVSIVEELDKPADYERSVKVGDSVQSGCAFNVTTEINSHITAEFINKWVGKEEEPEDPGKPDDPIIPGGPGDVYIPDVPTQQQIHSMPETGDNQSLAAWILLLGAACIALLPLRRRAVQ